MGHIVKPSSGKVIFGAGGVPAALLNPTGEGEHTFFGRVLSAPIAKTPTQDAPIVARPHVVGYMLP